MTKRKSIVTFSLREIIRKEYEIVETLSREFNIKSVCMVMNVSRSGYYKWLNRKGTIHNYQKNRIALVEKIKNIHKHHLTYDID